MQTISGENRLIKINHIKLLNINAILLFIDLLVNFNNNKWTLITIHGGNSLFSDVDLAANVGKQRISGQ